MKRAFFAARLFLLQRVICFEKTAPCEVMHLFVGGKLEMEKPRGYPSRRKLQANLLRTLGASTDKWGERTWTHWEK
jgi:hypothetical protein